MKGNTHIDPLTLLHQTTTIENMNEIRNCDKLVRRVRMVLSSMLCGIIRFICSMKQLINKREIPQDFVQGFFLYKETKFHGMSLRKYDFYSVGR